MHHLISNSSIQFIEQIVTINPKKPLTLSNGKIIKMVFCENYDPFTNKRDFNFLIPINNNLYVPLSQLDGNEEELMRSPNGCLILEDNGLPQLSSQFIATSYKTISTVNIDKETEVIHTIQTLDSFRAKKTLSTNELVPALELLFNKWLPMPLLEIENNGQTCSAPTGWCRLKMRKISENDAGDIKIGLTWAVDTTLAEHQLSSTQPYFFPDDPESKIFSLSNSAFSLLEFFFDTDVDLNGNEVSKLSRISEYLSSIFNVDMTSPTEEANLVDGKLKYIAYYTYFINYLRLVTDFKVELHDKTHFNLENKKDNPIKVDLVLDIGNSRTCSILFEEGDFTKRQMLRLTNLTSPWISYSEPFDMRFVIRKADFGNDLAVDDESNLFNWKSLIRLGQEAKDLIYKSLEDEGLSARTTNYSSPKRYLWDTKSFNGRWDFLIAQDDPLNVRDTTRVYIPDLTNYFDKTGKPLNNPKPEYSTECKFSRSSMMIFAFIEIFQHAFCQINSIAFRNEFGDIDRRRILNNIIITAPTAMANIEQVRLREYATKAFDILFKQKYSVNIVPHPNNIKTIPEYDLTSPREWLYDEATACQLVYLYAELKMKYNSDVDSFFKSRGHIREDLLKFGCKSESLTIGSIDIGAGTTDLMICAYTYDSADSSNTYKPIPLYWDSFYLAGDDILKNIVQCVIIEGPLNGDKEKGNLHSVLEARMLSMDNNYFQQLKGKAKHAGYLRLIDDIVKSEDPSNRNKAIKSYVKNLIIDFFGVNSANNNFIDRRCRVDFNTQVSVPIAQFMLEQLRLNRQSRHFKLSEILGQNMPSDYLMKYFEDLFGFPLTDILWEYNGEMIAAQIKKTMEPLMKQLSIVVNAYNIDVLMLAGRPTSLDALPDLFIKHLPVSPDRIVKLNEYQVGNWYPFAIGEGYFYDQKSVVAVGAYIGYLASNGKIKDFNLDFSELSRKMRSKSNFIGPYKSEEQIVIEPMLSPDSSFVTWTISNFPFYIGAKRINTPSYQSRALFAINKIDESTNLGSVKVTISRSYAEDSELINIEDAQDKDNISQLDNIELQPQTLPESDGQESYWLDNGAFKFL